MSRSFALTAAVLWLPTSQALALDGAIYTWQPVDGAAYYEGIQDSAGAPVHFRSTSPQLVSVGGQAPRQLRAYTGAGTLLGPVLGKIESRPISDPVSPLAPVDVPPPKEAAPPKEAVEPAEAVVPTEVVPPDASPTDEPAPSDEAAAAASPRPLTVFAAGTLGRERIDADGGYSQFDGAAVVGGMRLGATLGRPKVRSESCLSYDWLLDFHRFSFNLKERLLENPAQDRTIKERLNLTRLIGAVNAALWSARSSAELSASLGLAYEWMPTLKITDASRGETRLAASAALMPLIGLTQAWAVNDALSVAAGLRLKPVAVASKGVKASAFEAQLSVDQVIAPDTAAFLAFAWRRTSLQQDLDCPAIINLAATCRPQAETKSTLMQLQLGASWTMP